MEALLNICILDTFQIVIPFNPFKDEAQTALFKNSVRTAQ